MKKGDSRQKQILECAQKVFSQKGYNNTQVSDITECARIARGTVYQYFKNKEDIFLKLLQGYIDQWENEVSIDINEIKSKNPANAYIKHRISKSLEYFANNKQRCKIILRTGIGINRSIESRVRLFENKVMKLLTRDLQFGKKQGFINKKVNTEIAATAILGAILRISYCYFVQKKTSYQHLNLNSLTSMLSEMVESSLQI